MEDRTGLGNGRPVGRRVVGDEDSVLLADPEQAEALAAGPRAGRGLDGGRVPVAGRLAVGADEVGRVLADRDDTV